MLKRKLTRAQMTARNIKGRTGSRVLGGVVFLGIVGAGVNGAMAAKTLGGSPNLQKAITALENENLGLAHKYLTLDPRNSVYIDIQQQLGEKAALSFKVYIDHYMSGGDLLELPGF